MWNVFTAHLDVVWGFLVAFAVVVVLTPAVGRVARVLGVVDEPGEARRMHLRAVPRLGGLAIFLGIFIPGLAFLDLSGAYRGILLGAAVATAVGMADDFRGLPWALKLAGQGVAAGIAIHFGVYIDRFSFPLIGVHELPYWLSVLVTLFWIVGMMNVINLLDGMDGLAAGISAIAGATFAILALELGRPEAAVLSAIVCGACLGFLRHNFYPARIFMGDSGSHLLGFVLATVAIQGSLKTAATVALIFPLIVLAVPILDTSFVIAKRLKYGRPLTEPTPWHLYHRFRNIGFTQRRAAIYFYVWGLVLAGGALATRFVPFRSQGDWHLWPTVLVAVIAAIVLATSFYMVYVLEILKLRRLRSWASRRQADEPDAERRLKSA
jgi:UDP-GlcNAc:undecaprenyl-phosphate/decaprenyl-phosphate GlcNAc-1-phosphate transferase